ncbi:MAG TPA: hypothetical protein VGE15_07350 [Sphingobacteriaceae bacterium]
MKLNLFLVAIFILGSATQGYSQKYKNPEDSTKLNAEFLKVTDAIASLTSELTMAKNDLPSYKLKASTADSDAQSAASASSDEASRATNGKLDDSRSAKKRAKQAYARAKDSRSANREVTRLENRIGSLTDQLHKENQRLQELKVMRAAISNRIVLPPPTIVEP